MIFTHLTVMLSPVSRVLAVRMLTLYDLFDLATKIYTFGLNNS
jgi:hypothetical protein